MAKQEKVKSIAKKLEKELSPDKILNSKYADQNFLMQRELHLYEKSLEQKRADKQNDKQNEEDRK